MIANPIAHIQQRMQELTEKVTSGVDFATVLAGAQQAISAVQGSMPAPAADPTAVAPTALPAAATAWLPAIREAAAAAGIDPKLLAALVWTESGFDADAVSEAGAIGLAQLMPETAAALGVDPTDPIQNLSGGAVYLREQIDRFGRIDLALAAYNAGPTRVASTWDGGQAVPVAQGYVQKVMSRFGALSGTPSEPAAVPLGDTPSAQEPAGSTDVTSGSTEDAGGDALPGGQPNSPAVPAQAIPVPTGPVPSSPAGTSPDPAPVEAEAVKGAEASGRRESAALPAQGTTNPVPHALASRVEQPAALSADPGVPAEQAPPTSLLAERIVEVTRALAAGPPPRSITLSFDELDGLRMTVSLRGTQVHLRIEGLQPADRPWMGQVAAALTRNGFDLAGDDPREKRHFEEWQDPSTGRPFAKRPQPNATEVVRF